MPPLIHVRSHKMWIHCIPASSTVLRIQSSPSCGLIPFCPLWPPPQPSFPHSPHCRPRGLLPVPLNAELCLTWVTFHLLYLLTETLFPQCSLLVFQGLLNATPSGRPLRIILLRVKPPAHPTPLPLCFVLVHNADFYLPGSIMSLCLRPSPTLGAGLCETHKVMAKSVLWILAPSTQHSAQLTVNTPYILAELINCCLWFELTAFWKVCWQSAPRGLKCANPLTYDSHS